MLSILAAGLGKYFRVYSVLISTKGKAVNGFSFIVNPSRIFLHFPIIRGCDGCRENISDEVSFTKYSFSRSQNLRNRNPRQPRRPLRNRDRRVRRT